MKSFTHTHLCYGVSTLHVPPTPPPREVNSADFFRRLRARRRLVARQGGWVGRWGSGGSAAHISVGRGLEGGCFEGRQQWKALQEKCHEMWFSELIQSS